MNFQSCSNHKHLLPTVNIRFPRSLRALAQISSLLLQAKIEREMKEADVVTAGIAGISGIAPGGASLAGIRFVDRELCAISTGNRVLAGNVLKRDVDLGSGTKTPN